MEKMFLSDCKNLNIIQINVYVIGEYSKPKEDEIRYFEHDTRSLYWSLCLKIKYLLKDSNFNI